MNQQQNKLMLGLTLGTFLLSIIIHIVHRVFDLIPKMMSMTLHTEQSITHVSNWVLNIILIVPMICLLTAAYYTSSTRNIP